MFNRYFCLWLLLVIFLSLAPCYGDSGIITNGGFESGTDGWSGRGCSISAVASPVHSGSGSAKAFDRTDTWQGITQSVLGKMKQGTTYQISGWARLESAGSETVIVSVEMTDDSGTNYINVGRAVATDSDWVQVSGEFTLEVDGTLQTLDIYFEGPEAGVNFFVDDVSVVGPAPSAPEDANKPKSEN